MLLNFVWNPNPVAFDLGFTQISWYGLTWSISIIIGYLLTKYFFKKENKDPELATVAVQYAFFGSLIGARIFDVFFYHFDLFLANPIVLFKVWEGGLSSHGAMIGVLVAFWIFSKRHADFKLFWSLDIAAIIMPLLGAFVRIGNFINSELVGKASNLPWAVSFPYYELNPIPRHPVQLYEAFWLVICFLILLFIYHKRQVKRGFFATLFLILVLSGRVLLEFMKDSDTYWGPFSNTQWFSIIAIIGGIYLLFNKRLHLKH